MVVGFVVAGVALLPSLVLLPGVGFDPGKDEDAVAAMIKRDVCAVDPGTFARGATTTTKTVNRKKKTEYKRPTTVEAANKRVFVMYERRQTKNETREQEELPTMRRYLEDDRLADALCVVLRDLWKHGFSHCVIPYS